MMASLIGCNGPGLVHVLHLNQTAFLHGVSLTLRRKAMVFMGSSSPLEEAPPCCCSVGKRMMPLRIYMPYSPKTAGMNTSHGEGALEINTLRVVGKQSRIS